MRSLPDMTVLVPSDAASTRWATKYAVDTYGPMYLRLSRDVYPDLYDENTKFECGKGAIVRDGTDVTVIACGIPCAQGARGGRADGRARRVRACGGYVLHQAHRPRELILRCAQETRRSSPPRTQHLRRSWQRCGGGCSHGAARLRRRVCRHSRHVHRDRQVHRSFSPNTAWMLPASCAASSGCSRASTEPLHGSRRAACLPAFFIGSGEDTMQRFLPPGRTELAGNRTDHQLGRVLAASVDVGIRARAAPP